MKIDALNSRLCLYNLNLNQIQYSSLTHSRLRASKWNTQRQHPSVLSCLQVRAKLWKMLCRPPTHLHKSCKLSANCECHLRSCTLVNGEINHGSCQRQINKFSHHGVKVKNTKLQLLSAVISRSSRSAIISAALWACFEIMFGVEVYFFRFHPWPKKTEKKNPFFFFCSSNSHIWRCLLLSTDTDFTM